MPEYHCHKQLLTVTVKCNHRVILLEGHCMLRAGPLHSYMLPSKCDNGLKSQSTADTGRDTRLMGPCALSVQAHHKGSAYEFPFHIRD